ncbi:methyltransferase [Klugiella xanthotipulae]|uniref:16S rRNA (Guanine1207-N2)-methyltransferase n=1 Tax=Klugiella xanthotipulae TaxID=244735 RepID=A0A543I6I3_9MICO|nr:class I SAM-dependent methyltransferase [Klugiella xanthotipulae]TQM66194.1 16S rRNA (guanine1207-N2)-methyltransferase [Klugiella xanthotipulae]
MTFPFEALRRFPDVEAANLYAVDGTDRLLLDETAAVWAGLSARDTVVIGDRYGALTLGLLHELPTATQPLRVHQDGLSGERALALNAGRVGIDPVRFENLPLGGDLLRGARLVLLQLPRSLDALDEIAGAVARHAPGATLYAGGRLKHLTLAMNDVLGRHFGSVLASRARQKSRLLVARDALPGIPATDPFPRRRVDGALGIEVWAYGAAFGGPRIDPGSRLLLGVIDGALPSARRVIDLGCGTGVLARRRPVVSVIATDHSAAAVLSARETVQHNGVADRVTVVRDDGLDGQPDSSADLILLNPPFHIGATVHAGIAHKLFAHAARVLRPGGELWTVYNSHLGYRPALERAIGPTRQVTRDRTFTVTASTRRPG